MVSMDGHPQAVSRAQVIFKGDPASISDISRGQQQGVIAGETLEWTDGMEEDLPNRFKVETNLKGKWLGQAYQTSQFSPSELSFGATEENAQVHLTQKIQLDLSSTQTAETSSAPQTQSERPQITPGDIKIELGAQFTPPSGKTIAFTYEQNLKADQNIYQLRNETRLTEALSLQSSLGFDGQQTSQTLSTQYTPQIGEQTVQLSAEYQVADSEMKSNQKFNANLAVEKMKLSLGREKTTSQAFDSAFMSEKQVENLQFNYAFLEEQVTVAYTHNRLTTNETNILPQTKVVLTSGQEITVHRALSENLDFKGDYKREKSQEASPFQPDPPKNTYHLGLQYKLSPQWLGQIDASRSPEALRILTQLKYQALDEEGIQGSATWEVGLSREEQLFVPELSQRKLSLSYSEVEFRPQELALDCKFDYTSHSPSSAVTDEWKGEMRLYGHGKNALPLEATLTFSSEPQNKVGASLHYYYEF